MIKLHTLQPPMNVVVIGGSRGFGRSMVKRFHEQGHNVIFTSRREPNPSIHDKIKRQRLTQPNHLIGVSHDLSDGATAFMDLDYALQEYMAEGVDVWINNAAISDNYLNFHEHTPDTIDNIIKTNLGGSIMSTHKAIQHFKRQAQAQAQQHTQHNHHRMGHVFNVVGAGSNGLPTPQFSVYGATKAGIAQFVASIRQELSSADFRKAHGDMGIHLISPGMMPTDLLTHNASPRQLAFFNILCEDPDIVAAHVYERIMGIVSTRSTKEDIRYMTLQRVMYNLVTFRQRQGRFFKAE